MGEAIITFMDGTSERVSNVESRDSDNDFLILLDEEEETVATIKLEAIKMVKYV